MINFDEKIAKIEEQEKALKKKKADIKKAQKKKELAKVEKNKFLLAQFGAVLQKILGTELDEKMLKPYERFLLEQEERGKFLSKAIIKE